MTTAEQSGQDLKANSVAFDKNTLYFWLGLAALFAGLWLLDGLGLALTVCGAIACMVSVINSWIVVWISVRGAG